MRNQFATELHELMVNDKDIVFITADVGYGFLDKIKEDFEDRFYNVGAAEHVMMDMAVGMSLSKKRVITYSITPFLLFRAFEVIRNYINHEKIPVIMVGTGRNDEYGKGISHYAGDDNIIKQFANIEFIAPEGYFNLRQIVYSNKPTYLNLKR